MKIEILLHNETGLSLTKEDLKKKVITSLKSCFEIVTDKHLEFQSENNGSIKVSYIISQYEISTNGIESALCYLTLESEQEGMRGAKSLDRAYALLQQGVNTGSDKFLTITILDERSKYYATKAYPFFCDFETKLRCLILKLLTKSFGVLWAQKTLTPDLEAKLKERLKGADYRKLAKEAIYEMDFYMLGTYLFYKTRIVEPEEIVDNLLNEENLSKLSISEIQGIIAQAKPKSLWERYFSNDVSMPDLERKLSDIRTSRNKIAHNKRYELRNYSNDKLLLNEFCKQIDIAIEKVEVKPIDYDEAADSVQSFIALDFPAIRGFADALRTISELTVPINKSINISMQRLALVMQGYDSKVSEVCAGLSKTLKYFAQVTSDIYNKSDSLSEQLDESTKAESVSKDVPNESEIEESENDDQT
ncbi:MAG TPA: hypothetical protein PKA81_12665 [Clostridia bacterium]|nr:hypothetical protein [Clostridia bacterium]